MLARRALRRAALASSASTSHPLPLKQRLYLSSMASAAVANGANGANGADGSAEANAPEHQNGTPAPQQTSSPPGPQPQRRGHTLASLPKTWRFTASLPADPQFPTPADSHRTPRDQITPRQVRGALFTWVRPEPQRDPELLAVSPAAMRDLGLDPAEAASEDFRQTAAGNRLWGWDAERLEGEGYPWAQCYGGFQFGQWAGQLGDGRAVSLFEASGYEVQLKGAGVTPYSRFADGKAVLRSSIREFVVSEALHALGIPTTRALALTLLPHSRVLRETAEPGAIVVRFAPTWLRLGTFDLLRARGDRALLRRLATYAAESDSVLGGWEALPARLDDPSDPISAAQQPPRRGIPPSAVEGPPESAENRFARLYREVVRRNAATVARWQAYGFMNGVLNTDNTSLAGLSLDYGPFAFMDAFDPAYTPNHDDHFLRYSYRNQPSVVWWNLVRLAEALAELLGAGARVDDERFVREGLSPDDKAEEEDLIARAEKIIERAGEEYKSVFLAEYRRLMAARLGILPQSSPSSPQPPSFESDTAFSALLSTLLDTLESHELDFTHFFRRLSTLRTDVDLATPAQRADKAAIFFPADAKPKPDAEARARVADWLDKWRARVVADWGGTEADEERRIKAMKAVNPNFIPRGWILDEVIRRVEKGGERDVLRRLMHLALHPFEDSWDGRALDGEEEGPYNGDAEEEARWTGDVPRASRAMQCSCSS